MLISVKLVMCLGTGVILNVCVCVCVCVVCGMLYVAGFGLYSIS